MVTPRDVINTIVEDILEPNIRHPENQKREKDKRLVYSDAPNNGDHGPKIGVFFNNSTAGEQKVIGDLRRYEEDRIRVAVQMRTDLGRKAIDSNFSFPDSADVQKGEDAIDWLAERAKTLIEDEANKDFQNSAIRQLGGDDEDVVLVYDQRTPFYPPGNNSIKREQVDFLVTRE